jgi:ribosomal protein S12 methylthiotransferase accessory factor
MRFSEAQYRDREHLNQRSWLVDYVPRRFDSHEEVDWSPVWSLTHDRRAYLPTMLLFADYPCRLEERFCFAESNGVAAGNCLEEAVLHGLLEVVERDCVSIWWYNRLSRPQVSSSELAGPYYRRLRRAYRSMDREWWVLDLTTDLGISCFAAVTRKVRGREEILLGLGAHLDPRIAVRRAVTEMNQVLVLSGSRNSPFRREEHSANWLREASLASHPYLAPSGVSDWNLDPPLADGDPDLRRDVERCCSLLGEEGLEVLVSNQTRPDVGVAVARVVVPGLRSFRARFGPGRLFDVPVKLGWLERPTPEHDLNPTYFFL